MWFVKAIEKRLKTMKRKKYSIAHVSALHTCYQIVMSAIHEKESILFERSCKFLMPIMLLKTINCIQYLIMKKNNSNNLIQKYNSLLKKKTKR